MAFLFEINDKTVFPNAETLLLRPFKQIWERDGDPKKHNALEELAFIEFMTSMKKSNPYKDYGEDKKYEVIVDAVITQKNWEPDELVQEGIEYLENIQKQGSATYSYYMSVKRAAENMKEFFDNVNLSERNLKSGNPIYKPRDVTAALNDTEKVLANLNALKKKVEEELYEETKNRSDKKISPFADPKSL